MKNWQAGELFEEVGRWGGNSADLVGVIRTVSGCVGSSEIDTIVFLCSKSSEQAILRLTSVNGHKYTCVSIML